MHASTPACGSSPSCPSPPPRRKREERGGVQDVVWPAVHQRQFSRRGWGWPLRKRPTARAPKRGGRGRRAGKRARRRQPLRNAIPQPLLHSSRASGMAVVAELQNEAPFVAEWLEYHRLPTSACRTTCTTTARPTAAGGACAVCWRWPGDPHPIGVAGERRRCSRAPSRRRRAAARHERFLQLGADGVCRRALVFLAAAAALRHAVKRCARRCRVDGVDRRRRVLWRAARTLPPRPSPSPRRSRGATPSSAASIQVPDTLMVPHLLRTTRAWSSRRPPPRRRWRTPGPRHSARPPSRRVPLRLVEPAHPGYCRPTRTTRARRDRPRRPRMVFTHGATNTRTQGSGWWPLRAIRPAARWTSSGGVDLDPQPAAAARRRGKRRATSWSSPTFCTPRRRAAASSPICPCSARPRVLKCMPTAGAAQYRNFADRWSRGYATKAGTLGDGGQAKRCQLRQWRGEFDAAQQGRSQLFPFTPLAASVASVRRASSSASEACRRRARGAAGAPSDAGRRLLGRAFSERSVVVVVGEGRSGTTLLGQAVFDAVPSFVYLYEPCRLTRGSLHGEECALFVARALSCRLSLDESLCFWTTGRRSQRLPAAPSPYLALFRGITPNLPVSAKAQFVRDLHQLGWCGSPAQRRLGSHRG